jgi:hypothetical protein
MSATIIRETDLSGMTTDEAIAFVRRRLDREFATELRDMERAMIDDDVAPDQIGPMLAHRRRLYEEDRAKQLDELTAAILRHDRRLN